MSSKSNDLGVVFKLKGELSPTFVAANKKALKQLETLARQTQKTANLNQLRREHTKALSSFRSSTASMGRAWGNLGRSIMLPIRNIALFGAAGGAALFGIANATARAGDDAIKTARKLGICARAYMELVYAAEQSGSSQQSLSYMMRRLNQTIQKTVEGDRDSNLMFQKLGISVRDSAGQIKNAEQVLMELSGYMGKMHNDQHKLNLVTAIFGPRGGELIPMLE